MTIMWIPTYCLIIKGSFTPLFQNAAGTLITVSPQDRM